MFFELSHAPDTATNVERSEEDGIHSIHHANFWNILYGLLALHLHDRQYISRVDIEVIRIPPVPRRPDEGMGAPSNATRGIPRPGHRHLGLRGIFDHGEHDPPGRAEHVQYPFGHDDVGVAGSPHDGEVRDGGGAARRPRGRIDRAQQRRELRYIDGRVLHVDDDVGVSDPGEELGHGLRSERMRGPYDLAP